MRMGARCTAAALGTAVLLGSMLGCGGAPPPPGPEDAVRRYLQAVRADDPRAAYALLDPATREGLPFDRFAALMRDNRAELLEQAELLEGQIGSSEVQPRARARVGNGESMVLVLEGERWRLESGVARVPVLHTPRDAVLALRQALDQRSLAGVARILSRATRDELEADIQRFLDETEDPLDLEYDVRGDRARVRTTGGREILLIREAGEWRVVDVQDPAH
jgi:hypothetical protein